MSATMLCAHKAGIPVFVTGGIGGVHREGEKSKKIPFAFIEGHAQGHTHTHTHTHTLHIHTSDSKILIPTRAHVHVNSHTQLLM